MYVLKNLQMSVKNKMVNKARQAVSSFFPFYCIWERSELLITVSVLESMNNFRAVFAQG